MSRGPRQAAEHIKPPPQLAPSKI
jgi:hypothetical protein